MRAADGLTIEYPAGLPIVARREELLGLVADNQVVVVAGETGSGKSTQLPKLCLELGRRFVGHTQPRRIAARAVAERVAEELGEKVGGTVGYAVRFTDTVGKRTRLKVMTDGILLNELQRDRDLSAYDTIIVDEAHERSLNIDFILGYLRLLLDRRPNLKVIVTSATIDTERFAEHFGGAPIVEVSGRTYPVEVRYRPVTDDEDEVDGTCDAVRGLLREVPGDVLVFQSGEREIRDTAAAIEAMKLPSVEVLPLFARLSAAEQHRVFAPHPGTRRVVIATNIAETSLTVPGIRSVVDTGTARISRYHKRTKVQRLPIEPVSQASADQRAGRCGRVADGVCVRLYAEDDYDARPEFTEPEILRTNLASVVLQMTALGLGDVESFPFVEPPDRRHVTDGVQLLEELGALVVGRPAHDRRLTGLGKKLARLPVDPAYGRMVLEAERNDCVHEVMVVAAALSIQDVRERPDDDAERAAQLHTRFRVPGSDFLGYLALWDHLKERQRELSGNAFRRECRNEYLHYVRIREWQDVYTQLRQITRSLKIPINREPATESAVHRSLLAGLLANVGHRTDDEANRGDDSRPKARSSRRDRPRGPVEYAGVRGATFSLGRRSSLGKAPPRWVMAAELVETNRLWAGVAATVQPQWIEHAARHIVTRSHGDPYWDVDLGAARVVERVSLKALTLVEGRAVHLDRIDPHLARTLFLLHVLVRGEWPDGPWAAPHDFVARNRARLDEVRDIEERMRRDILVDEDRVYDRFDAAVPLDVTDVRRFERWWREERSARPHALDLDVADLTGGVEADDDAFPTTWTAGDDAAPIDYVFDPSLVTDGAVFEIPVAALNRTDPAPFDWLVPGLRTELITELIRGLPKSQRRQLVPAPNHAAAVAATVDPDDGPLFTVVARALAERSGSPVDPACWRDLDLPHHLRPHFRILDGDDVVAEGDDLADLERRLRPDVRSTLVAEFGSLETDGLTDWTIGDLPRTVATTVGALAVEGYPSLIDSVDSVGVRILAAPEQQRALHWNGTRRLLGLQLERPARILQRRLDARRMLSLTKAPHPSLTAVADDLRDAVLDQYLLDVGPVRDRATWDALVRRAKDRIDVDLAAAGEVLIDVVDRWVAIGDRLSRPAASEWSAALDDITDQLAVLVFDGMAVALGADRLGELPRYLDAVDVRLDRLRESVAADRDRMQVVRRVRSDLDATVATCGLTAELDDVRWQIEELRVQQWAQHLGTVGTVSAKRIRNAIARARP